MKGIDVSNHQGNIDFAKVKADGVEIVIVKATEGRTYTDPYFEQNYTNAKNAGLLVGCYHFLRANDTDDEINNFLNSIKDKSFNTKIIVDMETDFGGIEINSKKTRDFADALIAKGYEVALYTYEYFYNSKLNSSVKDLPLWIAKYSDTKPNVPSYIGWQYGSNGHVNGITGYVDMNDFSDGILLDKCGQCQGGYETVEESPIEKGRKYVGDRCKELQEKLTKVGYDCHGIDGVFGQNTYNALISFQQKYLPNEVDGLAGNHVFQVLNSLITEMNKPKPQPQVQVNNNVKTLQHLCNVLGVRDQNGNSLDEDGIVGACTRYAVSHLPLCGIPYTQREATKYIQAKLNIGVDGVFGNISANTVKAWQSNHGLTSDGIVGSQTWLSFLNN